MRHDNADARLTPVGRDIGLVGDAAWTRFEERREQLKRARSLMNSTRIGVWQLRGESLQAGLSVSDLLRRPGIEYDDVAALMPEMPQSIGERVAIEVKIEGYVRREEMAIDKAARSEAAALPDSLDYGALLALSREAREKLGTRRPATLAAASRIPGVTPADVAILSLYAAATA